MDVYQLVYNQGFYSDGDTETNKLTQEEFDTLILAAGANAGHDKIAPIYNDVLNELDEAGGFDDYSFGDIACNPKELVKLYNAIRQGKIFVGAHEEGVFAFCRKNQIKEASKKMLALERKLTGPDESVFDF